jgi:alcohol dehydrogenase
VGITTDVLSFAHPLMHRREMTIMGSRNAMPKDFGRIIAHIEAGEIDTRPWITHRVPFGAVIEEFEKFTKPETGAIKAVIDLDE